MGVLKRSAINLVLISLCPVYATNLAEPVEGHPAVKHIAYTSKESPTDEAANPSSETQNLNDSKKNRKFPVRRSVSAYPRLVVVTSSVNVTSPNTAELESPKKEEDDEESDNSQSTDDFINVYAKDLLSQKMDLMIPTNFVGYDKW
jgi:hypothetical protein